MDPRSKEYRDEFFLHYMIAALWSSTDVVNGEDVELDTFEIEDIHPDTKEKMRADCDRFIDANFADLAEANSLYVKRDGYGPAALAGHDFWLTRCGHGTGFWDRNLDEVGDRLHKACGHGTAFPNVDLYIGDDGKIHQ